MNATSKNEQKSLNTLKRDKYGYGTLPGFEDFALPEEDLAPGAVVNGSEVHVLRLFDDQNATHIGTSWLQGSRDISAWSPPAPEGGDWNLAAVLEHEEGPFAVFAKPGVHGVVTGKAYAAEYLLGSMIKAATKHLKTLSRPWIDMKEGEQKRVLATVQQDCRKAVQDAVDIIASNARMTFPAAVDQVVFKDGVKCVLTLAKGDWAHSLADAEGGFVTIVIEERSKLLDEGDALAVEPDQKSLLGAES
ncbi:hypothetical protein [Massilia sp.]|uniref:hypothetical protein n=1 Tax=Massilia sp. TaxID=1882437 RepID=UPI00352E66FE